MELPLLHSLGTFSGPFLHCSPSTVAVDSRLVQPGAIFFALRGEKVDGHMFLQEAWKKGAAGAVIRDDFQGEIPASWPVMRVKDPLAVLQTFARQAIAKNGAKICAITGSIGKTTTKDFLATIVSQEKKVVATEKSHNSQIGLGLTLLNQLKGGEEWIIAEMGMCHAGDISGLTDIAPPDIALVTRVCLVHAANFSSFADIAKAKAEIFAKKKTDLCLFNADSDHADILRQAAGSRGKSFSMQGEGSFWSMQVLENSLLVKEEGKEYSLPKPLFPAPHVYENLFAAICASRAIGVSWEGIVDGLPHLRMSAQRLENVICRGIHFINDSFNACEPSMIAALNVLKEASGRRKIAVLGAIKELGSYSEACHRNVFQKACEVADEIYTLGQEWQPMIEKKSVKENKYYLASTREELILLLEKNLREGDTVLLKGSRWANQLWKVVEHFSG